MWAIGNMGRPRRTDVLCKTLPDAAGRVVREALLNVYDHAYLDTGLPSALLVASVTPVRLFGGTGRKENPELRWLDIVEDGGPNATGFELVRYKHRSSPMFIWPFGKTRPLICSTLA